MPQSNVFTISDQSLGYLNDEVLKVRSLSILPGEKVALLGESGSGKTTLLQSLYLQQSLNIAYCPQRLGLVEVLSVFHNIYMGSLGRHHLFYNLVNLLSPRVTELEEIGQLCDEIALQSKLLTAVEQLSGGQQQRTALGRALYQRKDVFLGDEPVSAVDSYHADQLLKLVLARHDTAVIALHNREQALTHFDRIIGLHRGEIVLDAKTSTVKEDDLAAIYQS